MIGPVRQVKRFWPVVWLLVSSSLACAYDAPPLGEDESGGDVIDIRRDAGDISGDSEPDIADTPDAQELTDTERADADAGIDDVESRCRDYCGFISDCLLEICQPDFARAIEDNPDVCINSCLEFPPSREEFTEFVMNDCPQINSQICQQNRGNLDGVCNCSSLDWNDTNAGSPCEGDGQCDGGDLEALCQPEGSENEQGAVFQNGYCMVIGCQSLLDCSRGDVCVRYSADENRCLAGCDDNDDCRSGYACWPAESPGWDGICFPRCGGDMEGVVCQNDRVCRDGACVALGDCQSDSDCPIGEVCESGECGPLSCQTNADCSDDDVCVDGACQ